MLFNSIEFFIFLSIVAGFYSVLKAKHRPYLLLIANIYFYASWKFEYLFLIFFITFSSYYSAQYIYRFRREILKAKILLGAVLVTNFGILIFFKYFDFFIKIINDLFKGAKLSCLDIILPVGISFYTFQASSYVIDVWKNDTKVEKNLIKFLLFITFFPQLLAGPIGRSKKLLPQLNEFKDFQYTNISEGFRRILLGLSKKMIIADRLSLCVNHVYNDIYTHNGITLIIATLFFSFQIYCDFSGYSDIAIGVAKIFGVDLIENFKRPYFSKTITEFWQRWHISLSTWFRDYIYIPMGGNRVSFKTWIFNILFVFSVSGLWHGANYTFIFWGAFHGLLLVVEKWVYKEKIREIESGFSFINLLRWAITFTAICFAWVFFRANSFSDALYICNNIYNFTGNFTVIQSFFTPGGTEFHLGLKFYDAFLSIFSIGALMFFEYIFRKSNISKFHLSVRWSFYILLTLTILWFGKFGVNEFVYFQF